MTRRVSMNKEVMNKVEELLKADSCCAELREAAENFKAAVGSGKEAEAAKALVAELKDDVMPIESTIAFMAGEMAAKLFGKEKADDMLKLHEEAKANGETKCQCAACKAGAALIELLDTKDIKAKAAEAVKSGGEW